MMTGWDLTVGDQSNIFLVATLDERQIRTKGPGESSLLCPNMGLDR